jgi:hypothetical protein
MLEDNNDSGILNFGFNILNKSIKGLREDEL